MFGKPNGTPNGSTPEVLPQMGTGPMMLMKALGLDPAALAGKVGEFEATFKAGLQTLVERSQSIDERLAVIDARLAALVERQAAFESALESRIDKNLVALADSMVDIQRVQRGPGPGPGAGAETAKLGPVRETKRSSKTN
jgi:hypothetical protein